MSATPETELLPGEWENKCDVLQKLIIIKAIRNDRVISMVNIFVEEKMKPNGTYYITPQTNTIDQVF
jgi:dynein heavy chain